MNHRVIATAVVAALAGSATAAETALSISFAAGNTTQSIDIGFDQLIQTEDGYMFDSNAFTGGAGWLTSDEMGETFGVESLTMSIQTDATRSGGAQTVTLDFSFAAGFMNSSFTVNASPLVFSPISSVVGVASAALTVQDRFNDGASLTPNSGGMYSAIYNGSNTFADLFPGGLATSGGASFNDVTNSGAYAPVAPSVSEISAKWDFTISAFDGVTGTSVFTVVPTPASAALLGLGGLVATRRRR
ncbi:MAG: VPLPA-CTERM sorting domain-containing protein [Phycisphaerales bacterium JB040]